MLEWLEPIEWLDLLIESSICLSRVLKGMMNVSKSYALLEAKSMKESTFLKISSLGMS